MNIYNACYIIKTAVENKIENVASNNRTNLWFALLLIAAIGAAISMEAIVGSYVPATLNNHVLQSFRAVHNLFGSSAPWLPYGLLSASMWLGSIAIYMSNNQKKTEQEREQKNTDDMVAAIDNSGKSSQEQMQAGELRKNSDQSEVISKED